MSGSLLLFCPDARTRSETSWNLWNLSGKGGFLQWRDQFLTFPSSSWFILQLNDPLSLVVVHLGGVTVASSQCGALICYSLSYHYLFPTVRSANNLRWGAPTDQNAMVFDLIRLLSNVLRWNCVRFNTVRKSMQEWDTIETSQCKKHRWIKCVWDVFMVSYVALALCHKYCHHHPQRNAQRSVPSKKQAQKHHHSAANAKERKTAGCCWFVVITIVSLVRNPPLQKHPSCYRRCQVRHIIGHNVVTSKGTSKLYIWSP